jgi:hypothetical protein
VPLGGHGNLVCEHVDDDQRVGLGILELLGHLLGGVEGIDVHQHAARLEDGEGGHGEPQRVRHLQRDAVARGQPRDLAQVDRQRIRHLVDLCEAERSVHAVGQDAGEGGRRAVGLGHATDQVGQGPVARDLDLRSHMWSVERRPRARSIFHHVPPLNARNIPRWGH